MLRSLNALAAVPLLVIAASGSALTPLPSAPLTSGAVRDATSPTVDNRTLNRKLMFGYQGWFGCPDDGSPLEAWEHWFRQGEPAGATTLRVDMWPDVSELDPDERCSTPLTLGSGRRAQLYSAYNGKTVDRHFRWMRDYSLPGVFLQRFVGGLNDGAVLGFRDAVARNVRSAAESNGRVFAIMYDVSGHPEESLKEAVERDWIYLVDTLRITESHRYLHHRGRPVLGIWGLGFRDRSATAKQAADLVGFFKNSPDARYRVTLLGGVPAGWRTLRLDSHTDPSWAAVYRSFDVLSPWTVGRFRDLAGVDQFYDNEVRDDLIETRRLGMDYMPVVFPGFSAHNMNHDTRLNTIPRLGGRFYSHQVARALKAGSTMMYGAMFDEVDEGTALFKVARSRRDAPVGVSLVTLDVDGRSVPGDWYLRLSQEAQRRLAARR
jgi:hypothetical protein